MKTSKQFSTFLGTFFFSNVFFLYFFSCFCFSPTNSPHKQKCQQQRQLPKNNNTNAHQHTRPKIKVNMTVTVTAAATSPSAAAAARQKLALSYSLTHKSLLMRAPTQRHRSRSAQSFCRRRLLSNMSWRVACRPAGAALMWSLSSLSLSFSVPTQLPFAPIL